MNNATLGERIEIVLKESGLKKYEFAEKINVDQSYIPKMISGINNPSDRVIDLICNNFDINKEWLIYGTGDKDINYSIEEKFAKAMDLIFKDKDPFIRNMIIEMAFLPQEEKEAIKETISIIKKITSK